MLMTDMDSQAARARRPEDRALWARQRRTERAGLRLRDPNTMLKDFWTAHPSGRKTCPGCRCDLPVDAYARNRSQRDSVQSRCRACRAGDYDSKRYGLRAS